MTMITIRELFPGEDPRDLDDLLIAQTKIWNQPEDLKYLSLSQIPLSEDTLRTWYRSHLEDGVHYYCAIENNGEIAGIAIGKADPVQGYLLLGLGVRQNARKRGIGKRLVQHVIDQAANSGYRAVDVTVFADNAPMLRLLLGLGFIPVRIKHHLRADGGDLVYLKLYLSGSPGEEPA